MKLTLEIYVPDDKVPPNATGRLLWQVPEVGQYIIDADGDVYRYKLKNQSIGDVVHPVIETREPWRVPDHLRHPAWNGCEIKYSCNLLMFRSKKCSWITHHPYLMLRLSDSSVDQMIPGHIYKLGEDAE